MLVGILLCWFVQADGLEGIFIIAIPSLFALKGHPIEGVALVFGAGLSTSILLISTVTTVFNSTIGPLPIACSLLLGLVAGAALLQRGCRSSALPRNALADLIPILFGSGALLLLGHRLLDLKDIGSRWWVLAHASEDNAAWLNMLGRSASRGSLGVADVENLGHTLPGILWVFRQVGDFLPGTSLLSPPISDANQMAVGVLFLEALLIAVSVYLSSATVCTVYLRLASTSSAFFALILATPAALGTFLGGLVLARYGYLSALAALVGAQALLLTLVRTRQANRPIWIAGISVVTGLSWFPVIPIVAIGLILEITRIVRIRGLGLRTRFLQMAVLSLSLLNIVLHLQQILRRYPDVDRLQGSFWIGSQNLVILFVIVAIAAIGLALQLLPHNDVYPLIAAVSVTIGWLAIVWFNDLIRTGGPAHYGTTKLTFVVMYSLLPLLGALLSVVVVNAFNMSTSWLPALGMSAILSLGLASLSNDANSLWPRNPTEEERKQNALFEVLPLIQKAASSAPRSVICLFVGDFEATGKWSASYGCTRWGSSLAGVDGPKNELFRQTILGNGVPEDNIRLLVEQAFFRGVAIVTDNPERLAQLNPWGVISEGRKGDGTYIVFRPSPATYRISDLTP